MLCDSDKYSHFWITHKVQFYSNHVIQLTCIYLLYFRTLGKSFFKYKHEKELRASSLAEEETIMNSK